MKEPLAIRAAPGPGFIADCTITTWLDTGPVGPVAWLLIGHATPRRPSETAESIEHGLMGMIDAMRLLPATDRVPSIGDRLLMRGAITALDYGHPQYFMRIPHPGATWRAHVARGGHACVTITLDPIPPGTAQDGIDAYLRQAAARGRVLMGATGIQSRERSTHPGGTA